MLTYCPRSGKRLRRAACRSTRAASAATAAAQWTNAGEERADAECAGAGPDEIADTGAEADEEGGSRAAIDGGPDDEHVHDAELDVDGEGERSAEEEEFHGRGYDSMTLVGVLCGLLCAAGVTPSLPAL